LDLSTAVTATGEKPLTSAALRELSARSDLQGHRSRGQPLRRDRHFRYADLAGVLDLWHRLALPLIVVQGYFVAFLFMVVHETAHKTAFGAARSISHSSSVFFAIGLLRILCLFTGTIIATRRIRIGSDCWWPIPASDTQLAIGLYRSSAGRLPPRRDVSPCLLPATPVLPGFGRQAPHCRERSASLCRLLCRCLLLASLALQTALLLWVWIVPLIVGQLFYVLISMPSTPGVNGRAAPFRTPAPLTPACS